MSLSALLGVKASDVQSRQASHALHVTAMTHDILKALPLPAALMDGEGTLLAINPALKDALFAGADQSLGDIAVGYDKGSCVRLTGAGRSLELDVTALESGGYLAIVGSGHTPATALPPYRLDTLTGLPDRSVLKPLFKQLHASAENEKCALLLIDLDRFKNVNDTLGHPVGDALLVQVVERLKSAIRDDDTLLRLGGDEFVLIQRSANQPEAAESLAKRLIDLVSRSYMLDNHAVGIGASIGITVQHIQHADADTLLKNADLALYHAKQSGRGQYHFFEPAMAQAASRKRALEDDLRNAIALKQFEVHYQPLAELSDKTITGVEALVRWQHPHKGLIPPDDFIPLAEETGLIIQIGEFVLNEACQAAAKWPGTPVIAVNVSALQIETPGFVDTVKAALMRSGLAPERLEIEITESLMIHNTEQALAVLEDLKALRVRIVMDDFGTGYSSLSHLRAFAFDKVKIDRSFIASMGANTNTDGVIQAIVDLGLTLGMKTSAEGVETEHQLEQLKLQGCCQVQGYFISRPLNEADMAALLAGHHTSP